MARKLEVSIVGNSRDLERALNRSSSATAGFAGSLNKLGKVAAVGVGAAFAGLAATLKVGFDELFEGQTVAAQTAAALKSTGGVANVTASDVANLSGELSRMSGIDDELVQKGANLLLTFKGIRNEVGAGNAVFDRATKSALNLSVAGFGSVESTSKMMGKALNDPIKGMTALGRAGVTFTAEQKKAITAMAETGNMLGAQKAILKEVESQVGGSAKAFGETMPGQLAKLKNSFAEVAGGIAQTLLPYLTQLLGWVNDNMPTIQRVIQTSLDAVVSTIEFLAPIVAKVAGWFQVVSEAAQQHWPRVRAVIESVVNWFSSNVLPTVMAVVNAITAGWRRFGDEISAVVGAAFSVVSTIIGTSLRTIKAVVEGVLALIRGDWGKAWESLKTAAATMLEGAASAIKQILTRLVPAVASLALAAGTAIVQAIGNGLAQLGSFVWGKLQQIPTKLAELAAKVPGWARAIGAGIVGGIVSGLSGLFASVKNKIIADVQGAIDAVKGWFMIDSPSKVTSDQLGKPLAEGVLLGWIAGSAPLPENMKESVRNAIEAARKAIDEKRGVLAQAFSELSSEALAAFDKLSSELETRTEEKMRLQDERRAKADRGRALREAQAALTAAQAQAAAVGPHVLGQAKPEGWDEAAAALVDAERQVADARFAIQRALDEKRAAQERRALDERRAKQRRDFEEELAELGLQAQRRGMSAEETNKRLIKIFDKYNVPFRNAARDLGLALAEGLRESTAEVERAAAVVRHEIMKHLSNLSFRVSIDVSVPDKPDRDKPPGRARGGPVTAGMSYIVGEKGPELFVPGGSGHVVPAAAGMRALGARGGGGVTVHVHVAGSVTSEYDLAEKVRTHLIKIGKSNGGQIFGDWG